MPHNFVRESRSSRDVGSSTDEVGSATVGQLPPDEDTLRRAVSARGQRGRGHARLLRWEWEAGGRESLLLPGTRSHPRLPVAGL